VMLLNLLIGFAVWPLIKFLSLILLGVGIGISILALYWHFVKKKQIDAEKANYEKRIKAAEAEKDKALKKEKEINLKIRKWQIEPWISIENEQWKKVDNWHEILWQELEVQRRIKLDEAKLRNLSTKIKYRRNRRNHAEIHKQELISVRDQFGKDIVFKHSYEFLLIPRETEFTIVEFSDPPNEIRIDFSVAEEKILGTMVVPRWFCIHKGLNEKSIFALNYLVRPKNDINGQLFFSNNKSIRQVFEFVEGELELAIEQNSKSYDLQWQKSEKEKKKKETFKAKKTKPSDIKNEKLGKEPQGPDTAEKVKSSGKSSRRQSNRASKIKEIKVQELPEIGPISTEPAGEILFVEYDFEGEIRTDSYPLLQFPEKGTVVRSHRRGSTKRMGYKEIEFQGLIQTVFGGEFDVLGDARLNTGKDTRPFEPDVAIVEKGSRLNLRIDIEIDEPYAGITRQPTHCKGEDAHRDTYFTARGWMVIRFSEYQVHDNPLSCLRFIAEIIAIADPEYSIPDELLDAEPLEEDELWDAIQAQKWQKEDYREEYLDHTFQEVDEKEETRHRDFDEQEMAEETEVRPSSFGKEEFVVAESFNLSHAHPRDKRIKFYPEPHIYTIDNTPIPSVSTIISKFFPEFDAFTAAGRLGPTNPLFGLPVHEIVEMWDQKGKEAANHGTFLHKQIENYYLGKPYQRVQEFAHFEQFVSEHRNLNPFRTEWRIFDEHYHIAGTIDLVSKTRDGFEIYDWKRSKKVVNPVSGEPIEFNQWGTGIGSLAHLDDTSFNKYSLQQSIYKYILEENYGIVVSRMFLVVLYPEYGQYYKVSVPYLESEAKIILNAI
jgi:hypothetical protein